MASSDDETEDMPKFVSNYYFLDDKDYPVSFTVLPIHWSEGDELDSKNVHVFLHGDADSVIQRIHKHVIGWKFDLYKAKPEISVLTKERHWIKLLKPRKSFVDTIGSILITVHCLHFVRRNPETPARGLWNHLTKIFSLYEFKPSQNDLVDHVSLISEAVKRDAAIAKSKFLLKFLEENPRKRKLLEEECQAMAKSTFIDDNMDDGDAEDDSDSEDDMFDSACAICDNGGDILCCEGKCLRAFHATAEAAAEDGAEAEVTEDAFCFSLGLTQEEVDAMPVFYCKNCEYKQHQCFVCGELGSSDKSSRAEVFRCVNATCGHFYHPHCVAKLIHQDNEVSTEELEKNIAEGGSFACPVHKCLVCKEKENKKVPELQFAVCRRCPKSYHRKCLPKEIPFEDKNGKDIHVRAWDGLLSNRILIYCLEHEIEEDIKTPIRNHIKFPDVGEKNTTIWKKKTVAEEKNRKKISHLPEYSEKFVPKSKFLSREESYQRTAYVQNKKSGSSVKTVDTKKPVKISSGANSAKKPKLNDTYKKEAKSLVAKGNKSSLGEQLFAFMTRSEPGKQDPPCGDVNKIAVAKATTNSSDSALPTLDSASERRMLNLINESTNVIKLEDIIKKHKVPSTHSSSSKNVVDKTITLGKVEGAIEAVRTALQKLEEGCSKEDAEAVCEPDVLDQIIKWRAKLKVYLAPFICGMRYSSFGRHFTKVDKLEEIVNKIHYYVEDGDMIVDFCCGANDFSVLMKKKLVETGKKCSYKNYDFIQPKNDFNFEKRDWMTVQPGKLPTGSRLIMGLNPPFGVKGALANRFIDKVLEFNPKLVILIVPPETERLDKKKSPYDLVWQDDHFLSGKSFYLPGSVDINDKQMEQWNVRPPVLYLWSRPDWFSEHKAIAERYGHVSKFQEVVPKYQSESSIPDHPMVDTDNLDDGSMLNDDSIVQTNDPEGPVSEAIENEDPSDGSYKISVELEIHESHDRRKKLSDEKSEKLSHHKQKHVSSRVEISSDNNLDDTRPSGIEKHNSDQRMPSGTDYGRVQHDPCRIYNTNGDKQYLTGTNRNFEEQFNRRTRDSTENVGRGAHISEIEEKFRRESDVRSQTRYYGQYNNDSLRSNYVAGSDSRYGQIGSFTPPSSSYGRSVLVPESSYRMNSLASHQCAPRLNELNHSSVLSPDEPKSNGNDMFDSGLRPPGFQGGLMRFASGPNLTYAQHNSAGWVD